MTESSPGNHEALAHHFDDLEQQHDASSLGMWLFLVTEIMMFGGLFVAYAVYRSLYAEGFAEGSRELDVTVGAVNTAVLIGSSLTMAFAVHMAQRAKRTATVAYLSLTILLGVAFLGVKVYEYAGKFEHHLFPGASFHHSGVHAHNVELFFCFYFFMTGLHAVHMIVGAGILAVLVHHARQGRFSADYFTPVECTGLYWHFVDIVWIFLYPLLYLLGRHE